MGSSPSTSVHGIPVVGNLKFVITYSYYYLDDGDLTSTALKCNENKSRTKPIVNENKSKMVLKHNKIKHVVLIESKVGPKPIVAQMNGI